MAESGWAGTAGRLVEVRGVECRARCAATGVPGLPCIQARRETEFFSSERELIAKDARLEIVEQGQRTDEIGDGVVTE